MGGEVKKVGSIRTAKQIFNQNNDYLKFSLNFGFYTPQNVNIYLLKQIVKAEVIKRVCRE